MPYEPEQRRPIGRSFKTVVRNLRGEDGRGIFASGEAPNAKGAGGIGEGPRDGETHARQGKAAGGGKTRRAGAQGLVIPSKRIDAVLVTGMIVLLLFYGLSFLLFVKKSDNFIVRQRRERAFAEGVLEIGSDLMLAGPGRCVPCLVSGWNTPEPTFVWSREPDADVTTPPLAAGGQTDIDTGLVLVLNMSGALLSPQRTRDVGVWVDGKELAAFVIGLNQGALPGFFDGAPFEHRLQLPPGLAAAGRSLSIRLKTHNLDVPSRLGLSDDRRSLGLAIRSLRLERED